MLRLKIFCSYSGLCKVRRSLHLLEMQSHIIVNDTYKKILNESISKRLHTKNSRISGIMKKPVRARVDCKKLKNEKKKKDEIVFLEHCPSNS